MLGEVALLLSIAAGWFLARALTSRPAPGPRWTSLLTEISLGVLFGPGLASILYFGLVAAGAATRSSVLGAMAALLAACGAAWWKLTPPAAAAPQTATKKFAWTWALWLCVAAGLGLILMDFQTAAAANPNGEWDAMGTWNLRARYLAGGEDLWRRAVTNEIGGQVIEAAHPAYPLFLSGFVALEWTAAGRSDETFPMWTALTIALAAFALLGASLASRKSVALGLLAWLVLLASEVFASQTAAQYSDLLQGLAFLATLVLLAAADEEKSPRLLIAAGLAAGLSAWIKNEGLPFTLAALGIAAWRFRGRVAWLLLGAAPALLATAALKLFVSHGREYVIPQTFGEALNKIAGAGRWWQAALGFGKGIYDAGQIWTHPVLLMALLAFALRFVPRASRRALLWLWIPVAVTAAAEYGLYLITTANLDWHISTSVNRLVAQLWPALLWLFFLILCTPEELAGQETVARQVSQPARAGRKPTSTR